jgi:hypothetical protein
MQSLSIFTASPKSAGLVISEFNPNHADEKGVLARMFTEGLGIDALRITNNVIFRL